MKIKKEILKEAWELRQKGIYTMREIATKLNVNREELNEQLDEYLNKNLDGRRKPKCPKCGKIIKGMGDVLYCSCGYQREKTEWEKNK